MSRKCKNMFLVLEGYSHIIVIYIMLMIWNLYLLSLCLYHWNIHFLVCTILVEFCISLESRFSRVDLAGVRVPFHAHLLYLSFFSWVFILSRLQRLSGVSWKQRPLRPLMYRSIPKPPMPPPPPGKTPGIWLFWKILVKFPAMLPV